MDGSWIRFSTDLVGRLTGPMTYRPVLPPLMAAHSASRAGRAAARSGQSP
jgi:hypothetical protein